MRREAQGLPGGDLVLIPRGGAQSKVNLSNCKKPPRSLEEIPSSEENNLITRTIGAIISEIIMESTLTGFFLDDGPTIIRESEREERARAPALANLSPL